MDYRLSGIFLLSLLLTSDRDAFGVSQPERKPTTDQEAQAAFYQPDQVQTVHLEISVENLQALKAALPKRISVPATFRWRDVTVNNVAVRYKGNSSSNPRQSHKRSFLVKFNEYDKDRRFLGLRRVSFDNGVQFGSLFSEPMVTEMLRDLGLPTHRCNYAKLILNGKDHGVYGNVERIDQSFLATHFPDASGALFKVDEGGPGGNLEFIGNAPALYHRTFEQKNKASEKNVKQVVNFIRMINHTPPEEFASALQTHMEVDDFLKVTAVMLYAGAFDQLTGWNPHNYYLHHNTETHRWRYLPWDLDVGFCEVAFGRIPVLDGWHAAWPEPGGRPNPLLTRIVDDPVLLKRYRELASTILEKHFRPDHLCKILDAKYALIKDDLKTDPFPHRRVTNPTDRNYDDIVNSMKQFIHKRYVTAKAQLAKPGDRPKRRAQPRGPQPKPGPPSDDAPSELRVVSNSQNKVVLRWKDNAKGEAGHILQRANGGDGAPFQNRLGQPGGNVTEAADTQIQPGRTYRFRVYAVHPTPNGPKGTGVSNTVTVRIPDR